MPSNTVDRHWRTTPVRTDRRYTPRITVNGLAYLNLAPDNGGIVLNASEGGLCFQSRAPVRRVDLIRLWFSYGSPRIEAGATQGDPTEARLGGVSRFLEVCSELEWTDDTRKIGGLRFKNLSEAARQQIRDWLRESALVSVDAEPIPPLSSVKRSYKGLARVHLANLGQLFRHTRIARLWTGYSGGLVNGILLSAALLSLLSFLMHNHKLGDSLVQLGERLGGRPDPPALPANFRRSPATSRITPPAPLERTTVSSEPRTVTTSAQDWPPQALPSNASPMPRSSALRLESEAQRTPSVSRIVARPSVPRIVRNPAREPDESMLAAPAPEIPSATSLLNFGIEPSKVAGGVTEPEKYLEVGKFKEKPFADAVVDRISQLNFPVKVIPRSHFLAKSYQVLVGPYGSDSEAEAVHKDLSSHGFTPRSYERGKRDFFLRSGLKVGATHLPVGQCVITWESYLPDSIVTIENARGASVTLEGKWVKRAGKYLEDAVAFSKERDGSLVLLEIRFYGLSQTLVFAPATNH